MRPATYAPIALFVYNRPEHTQQTLLALRQCHGFAESPLYIFCDGANGAGDAGVEAARQVVRELAGDAEIVEAEANLGLAASIIAGVTRLCEAYGRVIVLEDDLVVAGGFLTYMNDALDKYADCESVMQISGHMYEVSELADSQQALFLPVTTSWGWATWKRAWDHFDAEAGGAEMLDDPVVAGRFNLDGAFDYRTMLRRQLAGKSDSWAIRWYWSVFREGGLVLFPPQSLVDNRGFDGSGTHGWRAASRAHRDLKLFSASMSLPERIGVDREQMQAVRRAIIGMRRGRFGKIVDRVISLFL